jgi:PhnB protein
MAKRSLSRQLDERVETILARRGAGTGPEPDLAPEESKLAELADLASRLRDLPRQNFKMNLKDDLERRALMAATAKATGKVRPVPEGYHTVTPYLCVKGAAQALEFYKKAFGATELMRIAQPDGRVGHAEIQIGDSHIMLADEFPEHGHRSPQSIGGSPVGIHLFVEDVDATTKQAIAAGAKVLRPVADQFYGDRLGMVADPFGHIWSIATHKEDLSPEEIQRRAAAHLQQEHGAGVSPKQEPPLGAAPGVRAGFNSITPYLAVRGAAELIDFVKQAFGAVETLRTTGSMGGMHAEVRIGNSMLMIGGGPGIAFEATPAAIHLYVNDVDTVYQQALKAGATSIAEPVDHEYGERGASLKDLAGNHWYIATSLAGSPIPEGFRSVTPYFHPHGADRMIDFLKQAFGADEVARYAGPDGSIVHAQVRIGDSVLEMGEAHGPYQPMPSAIYLYVADVDSTYQRALEAGATAAQPPADRPYGDRTAFVKDPFGTTWYIATHVRDVARSENAADRR